MTTYAVWMTDAWRARATAWLDDTLAGLGRLRTGPVEQPRVRPWGTVLRADTSGGPVWLKAPSPSLRFELPLLTALAGLGLDGTPVVLGTDRAEGLLLLADAGLAYPARWPDGAERAPHFVAAWPAVARLQRAAVPLVPELLAAGVADLRPAAMPDRFDEAVARARADHHDPDEVAVVDRLAALRPRFVAAAVELAGSRVPPSVDHNDLHDGNLAVAADGRPTVLDWGDAVIAHPFATLLVAEQALARMLGDVATDHPTVAAARRGHLARFADLARGEDLDRTARFAVALARVGRAWVWQRAVDTFAGAEAFVPPAGFPTDFARGALRHLGLAADALA